MSQNPKQLAKQFLDNYSLCVEVLEGLQDLRAFREIFPFRENPRQINSLGKNWIYNPGKQAKAYFFWWLRYSNMKKLGKIFLNGEKPFSNARAKIDKFKDLLRKTVDDTSSLKQKVDADWETISGFGGEKHIAKKIIASYYPEKVIPIFKKAHLEHFATKIGKKYTKQARKRFDKTYSDITIGERWLLFNNLLQEYMDTINFMTVLNDKLRNIFFMRFLYHHLPP